MKTPLNIMTNLLLPLILLTMNAGAAERLNTDIDELLKGHKKYQKIEEQQKSDITPLSVYADSVYFREERNFNIHVLVRDKIIIGYLVFIPVNNTPFVTEDYKLMMTSIYSNEQFEVEIIQEASPNGSTVFRVKDKILYPKAIESYKSKLIADLQP